MSKPRVEKAPNFELGKLNFGEIQPYLDKYDITDDKGRYLHWEQLKWRVPKEQANAIWQTIKFKRALQKKFLPFKNEAGELFSYCCPHSMEAMLHQIVK